LLREGYQHEVVDRLGAADLINLAVETREAPTHIGAIAILDGQGLCDVDGRVRLVEFRALLDRRLEHVPQLRRIIHRPGWLAGRPLWIGDPAFRIERHVHQVELAAPGDQEALLHLATELLSERMDRAHPLWRIWFVTGLASGAVAVIMGMHHVVADGLAAMRLVTSLLGAPDQAESAPSSPSTAVPAPGWCELVRDNVRTRLATISGLGTAGSPRWAISEQWQILTRSRRSSRSLLNAPVGPRRLLAVLRIGLAQAKLVAHREGCKVNDVILDLAAGGLRALLHSRGEPVEELWLNASVTPYRYLTRASCTSQSLLLGLIRRFVEPLHG